MLQINSQALCGPADMDPVFKKPDGLIGRFAVVKLWPNIKAAEDENIARLKITAKSLGLQCVEITPDGRLLDPPHTLLTQNDVDFVIHLHFETPKAYNIFSFVALWNPVQIYHDWGYRRYSRHLLTHDDFLSCSATWADDHVRRMTALDPTRDDSWFTLYHSLSEPIIEPTLGDRKIFYAGINWERVGKKRGRHQDLLDLLDPTGDLRIFGPKIFNGVDVWEGFASYSGSIPFDGVSILREINRCGIALVLSSDAHKESELMSNRLFESLAAGAMVICDDNPFAQRHFGDTLLHVDATLPAQEVFASVRRHVQWIKDHPDESLGKARAAQAIFRERFSLDKSLINIYTNLQSRRAGLEKLYAPCDASRKVVGFLMMPEYDPATLDRHIASCKCQRHAGWAPVLLIGDGAYAANEKEVTEAIDRSGLSIAVRPTAYCERSAGGRARRRRRIGEVMSDAIKQLAPDDLFCFIAPDEELFAEHIQLLAGALERNQGARMAFSNSLCRQCVDGITRHELQDELDLTARASPRPLGFGRFLFQTSMLPRRIHSALSYLDAKAMALLVGACAERAHTRRSSIICDIQSTANLAFQPNLDTELEVMRDYLPAEIKATLAFDPDNLEQLEPASLSISRLSELNRQKIAVELAHSIPIPAFFKKIIFGSYRVWLTRKRVSQMIGGPGGVRK
jgi:hypothetical protein